MYIFVPDVIANSRDGTGVAMICTGGQVPNLAQNLSPLLVPLPLEKRVGQYAKGLEVSYWIASELTIRVRWPEKFYMRFEHKAPILA